MRIEKLEFNKIKVTIYPVDLMDMNINIKNLKPDSPQLHSFLSDIMEKIKEETGFNPYSERTVVEASPVGDCMVLTVTTFSGENDNFKICGKRRVKAVLKKKTTKSNIFFFEKFDDMCDALTQISDASLVGGALYKIENKYALSFLEIKENEAFLLREFAISRDNNQLARDFLCEHAELIAKDNKFLSMSQGIKKLSFKE